MKVLVLSDAHSNIDALHAVERDAGSFDRLLFLGDMVDYGFYPREVIRWMRDRGALAVLGNHDRHLLELADQKTPVPADPSRAESFALNNLAQMDGEDLDYLRAIPEERVEAIDGIPYYMAHTYRPGDDQALLKRVALYESAALFEEVWRTKVGPASPDTPRRILYGHTHQCMALIVRRNAMLLNPGSLSYRLGPDGCCKGADYMLIQDGEVRLRHTDYEADALYRQVEQSGLQGNERLVGLSFYGREAL